MKIKKEFNYSNTLHNTDEDIVTWTRKVETFFR